MSSFTLPPHVNGRHQMVLEGSKVGASVACMSEPSERARGGGDVKICLREQNQSSEMHPADRKIERERASTKSAKRAAAGGAHVRRRRRRTPEASITEAEERERQGERGREGPLPISGGRGTDEDDGDGRFAQGQQDRPRPDSCAHGKASLREKTMLWGKRHGAFSTHKTKPARVETNCSLYPLLSAWIHS